VSFNALGLHAVPVAKKHLGLSRLDYLIDELKSSSAHFVGIQELHFRPATSEPCCVGKKRCDYHRAFAKLEPLGYASLFNDPPSGRGVVRLIYPESWSVLAGASLEPRVLYVLLQHVTGQQLQVLLAHMHHQEKTREDMWKSTEHLPCRPSVPLVSLCDHNSGIVPGCDSERVSGTDALVGVERARTAEVTALSRLGLSDAWHVAYPHDNNLMREAAEETRP